MIQVRARFPKCESESGHSLHCMACCKGDPRFNFKLRFVPIAVFVFATLIMLQYRP
jgi:hypothetical protein